MLGLSAIRKFHFNHPQPFLFNHYAPRRTDPNRGHPDVACSTAMLPQCRQSSQSMLTHSPTNSRSIIVNLIHFFFTDLDTILLLNRLCLSSVASSGLDSSVWRSVVKWKMLAGSYRRTIHGRQRHLPFARPVKQSKPSSVASRQIQTSIAASQMMSHPRDSENSWQGRSSQLLVFS